MIGTVLGQAGRPMTLRGNAGDFDKAISAVEFSLDGKRNWTRYDVEGATSDRIVYWEFTYTPPRPGKYTLFVRSVNEDGKSSPSCERVELLVS